MPASGLPYSLARHDPVSIGSDRGCAVVIPYADPHHAQLRWNPDDEAWLIHDDPAPGATRVNNDPIVRERLFEGDVIEIAGVRIRFAGNQLAEVPPDASKGVRVTVRNLSATIKDRDSDGRRKELLHDVSVDIREGLFTAILGPSGCGKSTLIQRLAGFPLDGETSGSVFLNGNRLVPGDGALYSRFAYLPQSVDDTFFPEQTVEETMESYARCHLPEGGIRDFASALDKVELSWAEFSAKPVRKLSGGQRRRLALALELMRDPPLLLLDEPTAGLDPAAEAGIMALLRRLSGQGKTILCATHVLGSLDQCRDVIVMAPGGQVAFHGSPEEALRHFGEDNWLSVYRRLDSGTDTLPPFAEEVVNPAPGAFPSDTRATSRFGAFAATFRRFVRSAFAKCNPILFAGAPVAVSLLLLWTCGTLFDEHEDGTVFFCMSVAMFWFGLSGSFRNLVAERVPKRCLDRLRGMPLGRYFAAHVAFAALAAFFQSLLFVLPVFAFRLGHAPDYSMNALPAFWLDLALVAFCGGCVGLFVGACAKKELYAAWALPLVAIPALFLSQPVLGYERGEKPSQPLRALECLMPTLYPQILLKTSMDRAKVYDPGRIPPEERYSVEDWTKRSERRDKNGHVIKDEKTGKPLLAESLSDKHVDDVLRFFELVVGYAVVFLGLACFVQSRRERAWDGR